MTVVERHLPRPTLHRRELATLLGHAFVLWALCTMSMMIGLAVTTVGVALVVHAIGAPIFAVAVSQHYFRRSGHTTPLRTAISFVSFVIVVDFFLVALVINRSLEMFASPLGTWVPFTLIFLSTYLTGRGVERRHGYAAQRR